MLALSLDQGWNHNGELADAVYPLYKAAMNGYVQTAYSFETQTSSSHYATTVM